MCTFLFIWNFKPTCEPCYKLYNGFNSGLFFCRGCIFEQIVSVVTIYMYAAEKIWHCEPKMSKTLSIYLHVLASCGLLVNFVNGKELSWFSHSSFHSMINHWIHFRDYRPPFLSVWALWKMRKLHHWSVSVYFVH